jgi:hypothetical protein
VRTGILTAAAAREPIGAFPGYLGRQKVSPPPAVAGGSTRFDVMSEIYGIGETGIRIGRLKHIQ